MRFDRQSGIFHHLTALPSPHGIGDLGAGAKAFLDFLDRADQSWWQFCPIGPTASIHGHSPYQAYSAFAGNPLLIDLRSLQEQGWLEPADIEAPSDISPHKVHYDTVESFKKSRLRRAFETFQAEGSEDSREEFTAFREETQDWLGDYTLFRALKQHFDGKAWIDWPTPIKHREESALTEYRDRLATEIEFRAFCQWQFQEQWDRLKREASKRDITLVGDLPIYVALDSADVWAAPAAFDLTDEHEPAAVAGVPPNPGDSGQRWGNPLYDWEGLAESDYQWWIDRLERLFDLVDVTRIDHFKGFDAYWAIPASASNPAEGEWRQGPGHDFFEAVRDASGSLPFIVEDLGFLDESLTSLRDHFDFPGMRVLQYADWCDGGSMHRPMNYPGNTVGYTATHDTDTVCGYVEALDDHQRHCLHEALGTDLDPPEWDLISAVWNSNAALAITTMPDLLGLGSEARFNTPGTTNGNWAWRITEAGLDPDIADRLAALTDATLR